MIAHRDGYCNASAHDGGSRMTGREAQTVLADCGYTIPGQRFALYRIAEVVNSRRSWSWWAENEVLAVQVGVSAKRVAAYLTEFVADGWLAVVEDGRGRDRPTVYRWARDPSDGASWEDERISPESREISPARFLEPGGFSSIEREKSAKTRATKTAEKDESLDDEFSRLWAEYPRSTNRAGALRAFKARRREGVTFDELERAVLRYRNLRSGEDERFTLHGSTFFGPSERWKDFLGETAGAATSPEVEDFLAGTVDYEDLGLDLDAGKGGSR